MTSPASGSCTCAADRPAGNGCCRLAWVTYAMTESPVPSGPDEQPYGAHWWRFPLVPGSFAAQGYEGQRILVVPDLDLVVVRLGITPVELKANLDRWLTALVDALRQA